MNPRTARWILEDENYEYEIKHRKCERMAHVDVLSRVPIAVIMDRDILEIRDRFEREKVDGHSLENGLVFRRGERGQYQLYVPGEMEDNIIRLTHEEYVHVDVEKYINQIRKLTGFLESGIRPIVSFGTD